MATTARQSRSQHLKLAPPAAAAANARAAFADSGPFAAMSEPALLVDHRGAIAANAAGGEVADDPKAMADLVRASTAALAAGACVRRILAANMNGRHVLLEFDVAGWGRGMALAIGRDVTVATGVREALEISRERYRALLDMAVDCIWETGHDGALELIAPNCVFGRPAALLVGQPLRALIACKTPGFHIGKAPRTWHSAGLVGKDGQVVLGAAIAEPILYPDGGRHGFRGCFRQTQPTPRD